MYLINNARVIEDYWTNHQPFYLAFKLPDYVPHYHHRSSRTTYIPYPQLFFLGQRDYTITFIRTYVLPRAETIHTCLS
jgi:hypothetical protein